MSGLTYTIQINGGSVITEARAYTLKDFASQYLN